MINLIRKVERSIDVLGGYPANDPSKFIDISYTSQALSCGLLVYRKPGKSKVLASSPETPWYPSVIGWNNQRAVSTSWGARQVTNNKMLTHKALLRADLPVAESVFVNTGDVARIKEFGNRVGWPIVFKPVNGMKGEGVITGIECIAVESIFGKIKNIYDQGIIQKHVDGIECRVYASRWGVLAALCRIPAHVVGGDGKDIATLIAEKNALRVRNIGLRHRLVDLDSHDVASVLESQGLSLKSVPYDGRLVPISFGSNISAGGDAVAVTDELHRDIAEIAINAVMSVPDRPYAGVDLILSKGHPYSSQEQSIVILEINDPGRQQGHLYPTFGTPINVVRKIIENTMHDAGIPIFPEKEELEIILSFRGIRGSLENFMSQIKRRNLIFDENEMFGIGKYAVSLVCRVVAKEIKEFTDRVMRLPCQDVVLCRRDAVSRERYFMYKLQSGLPRPFLND